jgi:glucokinase
MADRLAGGEFRARFEAKGRLTEFVKDIPTALVLHPYPAIIGAARELEQMERL